MTTIWRRIVSLGISDDKECPCLRRWKALKMQWEVVLKYTFCFRGLLAMSDATLNSHQLEK